MHVSELGSGRLAWSRDAVAEKVVANAAGVTPASQPARVENLAIETLPVRAASESRAARRAFYAEVNQQVAGAQQSLEFLDKLGVRLQSLRAEIGKQLAHPDLSLTAEGNSTATAILDAQVRGIDELWRERFEATSGTLDARLGFSASGEARQTFRVRGFDLASLRSGSAEVLSFSVAGAGTPNVRSARFEPGLSDDAIATRLNQALAPGGIRAARDSKGELQFSVPERTWPAVRDALSVRGEGRRFPTGQFSQIRVVADPAAIRPSEWNTRGAVALREIRQEVFKAQGLIGGARQVVNAALEEASRSVVGIGLAMDARASAEAARMFEAAANRADFTALSAITPALIGVSRQRITTLLEVGPTGA